MYSNSKLVGVFIVNYRTVVSLTRSHPPPSLAAHEVVHPAFCVTVARPSLCFNMVNIGEVIICNWVRYPVTNITSPIFTMLNHNDSHESWKSQLKKHIGAYIESSCYYDPRPSMKYVTVQSLKVVQVHQAWQSIPHDVRTVRRAHPKLHLLTGSYYILQENRAKFNQYAISASCLLCGARAETRFIAE